MSYEAYQDILLYRWNTQLIWLGSKADNGLQSLYFARPTPRVVWLPGKPRQKYFKRLYARLYGTIKLSSDKYTFSTLTYHTEKWSRESAAQFLPDHLKEFFRRLRKRCKNLQYFWVVELTKLGYPHVHLIFNQYIHHTIIRAIWYAVTKSYITDIRMIPAGNVAGYVTKYLTKQSKHSEDQFAFIFKNVARLWNSSRGFFGAKIEYKSPYVYVGISFNCMKKDAMIFRDDPESEFWEVPLDYVVPLMKDGSYIERILNPKEYEFIDNFDDLLQIVDYKSLEAKLNLLYPWRTDNRNWYPGSVCDTGEKDMLCY
jgi:hypothetical protein